MALTAKANKNSCMWQVPYSHVLSYFTFEITKVTGVLIFYETWPQSILQHLQFLLHHWWIFRSSYQLTYHHILAQSNLPFIVYLGFQTWWNSKCMCLLYILKLQNEITWMAAILVLKTSCCVLMIVLPSSAI